MENDASTASFDMLDEVFGDASVVFYTAAAGDGFALSRVSRNIGRVLGVRPEACVGSDAFWRERIHAEDAGHVFVELAGLAAAGCCTQEFRFRDDRNSYRWVSNEVFFKHAANGASVYLAGCLRDISATKNCEAELANNLKEESAREHFYRSVLDSMPQRLFWKDRNSVFRGCNLNGARALNLVDPDKIVGKTDYYFYPNYDEADYLRIQDEQVMHSGQASYHAEVPARQGDVWLDVTKVPLRDEKGEVYGLLICYEDVSAKKRIENELAESESRLREITGTVGEGIYVVDTGGIITFANPAATRLLGWGAKSLLGKNAHSIINCSQQGAQPDAQTGEDQEARGCWLDRIRRQRKAVRSDNELFKRKDGSQFQVSVIATPIFRDDQFAGAVVAFHDITEQKFTQKLLDDTLLKLRTVLDNAQIGVAYLQENKFSWINKHMEQMFGYPEGGLIGKQMDEIYAVEANGQSGLSGNAGGLLAEGRVYENEWQMKRSTGELFWCHLRGIAIDPSDLAKGSIWIMLDIDRLKKTETHLKIMNETLALRVEEETRKSLEKERLLIQQGRNAAMGEMIGNIAHQWRQPLSTLGLVVQNIQADYREKILDDSTLEKYVETARQAVQRMSSTIDDFRNFFRPNRVKERFPIYQSIYGAMQLLDAVLKNNGITIRLTGDQRLKAFGHPNEFAQVMLNLIANAKDALVERKVLEGHIDIGLSGRDGLGVIVVRDNAGGVDGDDLEKIFDPYFTTKPSGTGIGLYINKTIIEKHMNGRIDCRNTAEGAEFTIAVPLAYGDAGSVQVGQSIARPTLEVPFNKVAFVGHGLRPFPNLQSGRRHINKDRGIK